MDFQTYFEDYLDWELNQVSEYTDVSTADSFKFLPTTKAKQVVNSCIKELVMLCPDRFTQTYTYNFTSSVNELALPSTIARAIAFYDASNDEWKPFVTDFAMDDTIYVKDSKTIYNEDGWENGDSLVLKAVVFPDDITDDEDTLNFPIEYIDLLTLQIKMKVYGRKEKRLSELEYRRYSDLKREWTLDSGAVRKTVRMSTRGFGFGRR